MNIFITGGTGSLGRALIAEALRRYSNLERLVIFSRDEMKQWELQQIYPINKFPQIRFFIGDVRDRERLRRALNKIDIVIHAAALKQVPTAEYNPMEFIHTNVIGAQNLIEACLDNKVKQVIALSSDKASAPINLYGASKLCSDKLFVAANNYSGLGENFKLSVVRYGNVMGSRGSVIPYFIEKAKTRVLPITDERMTRFNISLKEGVAMVCWAIEHALGGEIFVPKIPSYRLVDLAEAIGPNCRRKIVGIRSGEKIHEEMITSSDAITTVDLGKYYAILPTTGNCSLDRYTETIDCTKVRDGFSYNSGTNPDFLDVNQIRALIKENISNSFIPI